MRLRGAVQGETGAVGLRQLRGRIGLAVAGFAAVGAQRRGVAGDPAGLVGLDPRRQQPGVVVPLHHDQGVVWHVFAGDKPRGMVARAPGRAFFFHAANAQARALAQCVERQADVLAQLAPPVIDDGAGFFADVAVQKVAKRALADKADASGVFLFGVGQGQLCGDAAHLGFAQVANRKQRLRQLRLVQPVQKIALVFAGIHALEQFEQAGAGVLAHTGVVAGGDFFRAQAHGVVEEGFELDFGIAQHVRVGRAPGLVFAQKFSEHAVFVVGGKVHMLDLDAQHIGHAGGI